MSDWKLGTIPLKIGDRIRSATKVSHKPKGSKSRIVWFAGHMFTIMSVSGRRLGLKADGSHRTLYFSSFKGTLYASR